MKRLKLRMPTLMLLVVIAALVTALIVQSRRIAELEAIATPTLKSRRMVAEKLSGELEIERASALKSGVGKDR
jgi:hypothetical protein